jgi:hypothetical protein
MKKFIDNNGDCVRAIDYPKNYPIPERGDDVLISDNGIYAGIVKEKKFYLGSYIRQITIIALLYPYDTSVYINH